MRMKNGPFIDAYKKGKILILDEINLSSKTVLQCIGEAIDNDYLSFDIPGRPLNKIKKKEGFSIIATQNPNSGFYEKKRQELGKDFLSRFQIIYFPSLTQSELEKIALGLGEKFKLKDNNLISKHELFIKDLVNFHIEWSNRNDIKNDIQCFTIREIAATIKALSPDEERDKNKTIDVDIYHTIMNIYGARYPKQKKNELEKIFKKYDSFKNLVPSKLKIPYGFDCWFFENKVIIEVINSVLFSLENQRHVIITGKEGNGKTQIAKWISEYWNQKKIKNKDNNENEDDYEYFCVCTENITCWDIIGRQEISEGMDEKLIEWKSGFLLNAIIEGKCAVLDSLEEAPSTVTERLNSLLDKKYDGKSQQNFNVYENPKKKSKNK